MAHIPVIITHDDRCLYNSTKNIGGSLIFMTYLIHLLPQESWGLTVILASHERINSRISIITSNSQSGVGYKIVKRHCIGKLSAVNSPQAVPSDVSKPRSHRRLALTL